MHNVEPKKKGKIDFLNQRSDHRMQHGATQKMVPVKKILKYLGHFFL